jgi:hypothetical protein
MERAVLRRLTYQVTWFAAKVASLRCGPTVALRLMRPSVAAAGVSSRRSGPDQGIPFTPSIAMHEVDHPVFQSAFTPQARQLMIEEDAQAWSAVTGILFAIVTGGALLGIAAVLMAI